MIGRALEAGVPFAWFVADEEFGQNPGLCAFLEERENPLCDGHPEKHRPHRPGRR